MRMGGRGPDGWRLREAATGEVRNRNENDKEGVRFR